jgi:hypothetical protein
MHKSALLVAFSAALAMVFCAAPARAQAAPKLDPLVFAALLLDKGAPEEACALLTVVHGPTTNDSRALYLLGRCHLEQGQFELAARYLERALENEPQAVIVRAQLAAVYIRLERPEQARLLMAEASGVSRAGQKLASLAAAPVQVGFVETAPPKNWSAEVSLARIYDSNANGGPDASTVDAIIAGVPLRLAIASSSQAAPDWGTVIGGSAAYLHPLNQRYALLLRGDASGTFYDHLSQYSRQTLSLSAGIVYRDERTNWSVTPNLRYSWEDGRADELLAAVDGRINYRLTDHLSITGAAQVGYAAVPFDSRRDAWIGYAGGGINYAFNQQVNGGVQLAVRRSDGGIATEAFSGIGPEIYLSADLTEQIRIDASYSFMHVEYDQSLGMFPQGRDDERQSIGVALNLDLPDWQQGLGAFFRYNYSNTGSSIGLYTSDRHVLSTGLKYSF